MKRHSACLALLAGALLLSPSAAQAQQRITLEIKGSAALPVQQLAGADLDAGFGFGATVALRLQPHLHLYGGWDWLHLSAEQSFAGADRDFEETGYAFGLRFEHPLGAAGRFLYRLEGGATYKHVEIESAGGELVSDSGHGLGYEVGAGLVVPFGASARFSPVLRYRALAPDFQIGAVTTEGNLRYLSLDLGLGYRF